MQAQLLDGRLERGAAHHGTESVSGLNNVPVTQRKHPPERIPPVLPKRLRVPPLPTRRDVVEALGQMPTASKTILMDQRRLHLQAEVCI